MNRINAAAETKWIDEFVTICMTNGLNYDLMSPEFIIISEITRLAFDAGKSPMIAYLNCSQALSEINVTRKED